MRKPAATGVGLVCSSETRAGQGVGGAPPTGFVCAEESWCCTSLTVLLFHFQRKGAAMRTTDLLFGREANTKATDIGLVIFRVFTGLTLALAHGWGKVPPQPGFVSRVAGMGFPAPDLFAWLAALAEFGGGLLIALGLFTRPTSFVVAVHFTIVVLLAHAGDPFGRRELPLFFFVAALLFLFAGPGRYSADAELGRRVR
jgi:putative oxidoreductase